MLEFLKQNDVKFDLHIHTTCSDGKASVAQIIDESKQMGLTHISITDHDTLDAYDVIKKQKLNQDNALDIINGVEITCVFEGYKIEILAYGFDMKKMKKFKFFSPKYKLKMKKKCVKVLVKMFENKNVVFSKHLKYTNTKVFPEKFICNDIMSHYEQNEQFIKKYNLEISNDFIRDKVNKVGSEFYYYVPGYLPTLNYVCDFVRSCGGKTSLAHGYCYQVENTKKFIERIAKTQIDGLEVLHAFNTVEEMRNLKQIAKDNNKMMTAGGDDHHKASGYKGRKVKRQLGKLVIAKMDINTNLLLNDF